MGDLRGLDDESIELSDKRKLTNTPKPTEEALGNDKDPNCNKRLKIEDENVEPNPSEHPRIEPSGSISVNDELKNEESDDDDEDEDYDGEGCYKENSEAVVDRKGKGIAMDYKGKGKVVEESDEVDDSDDEDDDDDDSSFSDGLGDGEEGDDLEEDPLAEVDLDNILPSRTRQGGGRARPGVRITGDKDKDNDV